MWKRILVPHDFSACAARAVDLACTLAEREPGAVLQLLHVSQLPPNLPLDAIVAPFGPNRPSTTIDDLTTSGARASLEDIVGPLRSRGIEARAIAVATASRDIAAEILYVAERERADVIVIGTHGRSGLSHLLLGSVAEKVIRGATMPVVTIRSSQAPDAEPTREEDVAEDELSG